MAKAPRASLIDGLKREKPHTNIASVGEAPMNPAEPLALVQPTAPAPVKEATQAAPTEPVVAESPAQEPQVIVIASQATAAKLPPPETMQPVVITAPVHPRQKRPGYNQLSIKLADERLARFEDAKHDLRLTGQQIMTEALDIWLAHNGF